MFAYVFPRTGPFFTGFELTARLASNPLVQAGTFESDSASVVSKNGSQYVIGESRQSFYWTPPATDVGEIRFYITGVGGQLGGAPDGNVTAVSYSIRATQNRNLPSGYRIDTFDGPGAVSTAPNGISNNGTVTGTYRDAQGATRSFIRTSAGGQSIFDGEAKGINSAGTVVGTSGAQSFTRLSGGGISPFNIPTAQTTVIADINDAGVSVGNFTDSTGGINAFFGTTPQSVQFFNVKGSLTGINDTGIMVGGDGEVGLIRQPDGSMAGISPCAPPQQGFLSHFLRINDLGHLVGYCSSLAPSGVPSSANATNVIADENGRTFTWPVNGNIRYLDINNNGFITGTLDNRGFVMTPCTANPTSLNVTINGGGGNLTIPVSVTPNDCRATISQVDDWISPTPTIINNAVVVYVGTNPGGGQRAGTVIIGNTIVTVTQAGVPCELVVTGTSSVSYLGGPIALTITGAPGCPWNARSTSSWLTFTNPNGTGVGSLQINVGVNSTAGARTATVQIGDTLFSILQGGAPDCLYTVNPTAIQSLSSGGNLFITVTTGSGCAWTVTEFVDWISATPVNTTSIFGSGTATLNLLPNFAADTRSATLVVAGQSITVTQFGTSSFPGAMRFVPITPCRVVDTRDGGFGGSFGGPRMQGNTTREFPIPFSSSCSIPSNARAYSTNMTVVPVGYLGYLTAFPTGTERPLVSTLNSWDGRVIANAAIVPAGTNGSISVFVTNETDVVIDINGYFLPVEFTQGLSFYPVTPCRVADTRTDGNKTGSYGPPYLTSAAARSMSIPSSGCNIPSYAQAFSLNVTAVPRGYLGFLTVYPDNGQPRPNASTLNSWNGQVVANAALVPAGGNGAINVFASNDTDVVVDINGYFAPAGFGGALNFFTLNPCRVADTRTEGGKTGSFGPPILTAQTSREIPVPQSGCNVPTNAQAYSMNVTAVPSGYLGFLTMYPTGQTLPFVSTLNSWDGQVIANAALVPAGVNGSVSVYVSNTTNAVLDINGYFAP